MRDHNTRTADSDLYGTVVIHTTATVLGRQHAVINVHAAGTIDAQMIVTFARFMIVVRSAAAVHGFIQGFAAAGRLVGRVDNQAPQPGIPGDDYARAAVSVSFLAAPEFAVTPEQGYSPARRSTLHWIDIHMGPITWRIVDRLGYVTMLDELRSVYRVATGVFVDGGEHRPDPTIDGTSDAFDEAEREEQEAELAAAPWRRRP